MISGNTGNYCWLKPLLTANQVTYCPLCIFYNNNLIFSPLLIYVFHDCGQRNLISQGWRHTLLWGWKANMPKRRMKFLKLKEDDKLWVNLIDNYTTKLNLYKVMLQLKKQLTQFFKLWTLKDNSLTWPLT